ncbi:TRAP transporter substrate-binding protein [Rhodovastum atsumiense]|uniref:TRAP transporter substrate-binding protein n=1 Tax=Rhodovastum atsumiense TaxID=504468 RepID=A0A5M6ILI5_9PROT|nr:TRAP transporter substrate-binding protein [Rhodovastum atsumiense]KAA5609136.1 TRAP transporter substrate-binding protein [Rhodovastum atsumiense]CAH2601257.1 TRAP transporter substrate-binding protein [Rhodovastum atsumiense]
MPTIRRRGLITAAAAAVPLLAIPAVHTRAARRLVYKYGNNLPLSHPLNVRALEAAERIKAASDGALEIRIFPNNQLGGDTDMLSQVRSGALDFFTPSALVIATLVPAAPINAVGFAFPSYKEVWAAMDGELGAFIRASIEKVGLHMLEKVWDNGFRQITTANRPIHVPQDLSGLKIRVPVSPLGISLFQALSASPTSLQFSEVYTALQTHVVDAQENPLPIVQTAKLYEVQNHVSLTNHIWDGFLFIASGKTWYRLPEDLRTLAARELNAAGERQREDIARLNESVQVDLQARGMVFNKPDPAPFREMLRKTGFYAQWKEKFGADAWRLLEKYVGQLG